MDVKKEFAKNKKIKMLDGEGFLIAINDKNEGIFYLPDDDVNRDAFLKIINEAKRHLLKRKYHVYGQCCTYWNEDLKFYRIK